MTDSSYTHIKVLADRSGSMGWPPEAPPYKEMVGGLNALFAEQAKVKGKCLVDYSQFDTEYENVYEDKEVAEATAVITPRGGTALNDGIAKAVNDLGTKLDALDEDARPGHVIVVIATDGEENSSQEFTVEQVKALVSKQINEFSWEFIFLGANIDAISTASGYGIARGSTLTYDTQHSGATMAAASNYITTTRGGAAAAFSDEDREAAVGK